jgi:hypothetical protein
MGVQRHAAVVASTSRVMVFNGRFRTVSTRAREGECELGTLAIGKTVSGTDFGDRMGVVADSSRNRLSTRSMWRELTIVPMNAKRRCFPAFSAAKSEESLV